MEEIFSTFGKLTRVELEINPTSQISECFGYVEFENRKDAERAVEEMDGVKSHLFFLFLLIYWV